MKKNAYLLALISLVIGAVITAGFTRWGLGNSRFYEFDNCTYMSTNLPINSCVSTQRGWPMTFLHSKTLVSQAATTGKINISSTTWVQVKTATEDWLIWSVVSAGAIGLLVYLLERAGISTGFKSKKSRR